MPVKMFGDINNFAIEYKLKCNPFNEIGLIGDTWGELKLWINGKDICGYERNQEEIVYESNLIYIVEWFCENLQFLLREDLINLPVEGATAIELYNNSVNLKSDDEEVMDKWFEERQDWYSRHNWYWNRSGSFLPEIFFRRKGNNIEIAWNNVETYKEKGIEFSNPIGIKFVETDVFHKIIIEFLNEFTEEMFVKYPENIELNYIKDKVICLRNM